ncbi:2287_t:CDS:1, partial [Ambispora leptoticha]
FFVLPNKHPDLKIPTVHNSTFHNSDVQNPEWHKIPAVQVPEVLNY